MCSFTFDKGPRSRRDGLHVQSRSYWAPANIGPYSQAIAVPSQPNSNLSDGSCVYVAGQIPLHPPTMELAWGDQSSGNADWYDPFLSRATLALQHLWRIGQANSVAWWFGAIAFLSGPHEIQAKAVAAYRIWQELHHLPRRTSSLDDEDAVPVLDAWDVKYGRQLDFGSASAAAQKTPVIPDWEVFGGEEPVMPPYLAVQVAELPRGSDVEWQALGARAPQEVQLTERDYKLQIEGQSDVVVKISQLTAAGSGLSLWCYIPAVDSEDHFNSVLEKVVVRVRRLLDELAPGSVEPPEVPHATLYTTYSLAKTEWPCLVVPCHSVYDRVGTQLAAGLVVHLRR
ncbi:hypothetical protein KEM55_008969 [Ascosphaera atra]|nr:hypothetical protein KEM55_008969 [Ascosphaera atra]